MNFYTYDQDATVIKSINNTPLGYKFNKSFDKDELNSVWNEIKFCKRGSTILIFIMLIILLYTVIFPNFALFIDNKWYFNAIIFLAIMAIVCQIITKICTFIFEKRLIKIFGEYEKTIFQSPAEIDKQFYNLFKTELLKALILILLIVSCFFIGSPFKKAKNLIEKEKYNEVIKITTIGSKIFPIAQEWYSLRGYAKFNTQDFEGAIKDYEQAYQLGTDGLNIMNFDNKIFVKYYIGDFEGAVKDFDQAISQALDENERDQFLWDKAQFLYNIRHYTQALELYSDLINKADQDRIYLLKDRLYYERAQVFKALNNEDAALEDLQNSGIDPEDNMENPIPQPTLILDDF